MSLLIANLALKSENYGNYIRSHGFEKIDTSIAQRLISLVASLDSLVRDANLDYSASHLYEQTITIYNEIVDLTQLLQNGEYPTSSRPIIRQLNNLENSLKSNLLGLPSIIKEEEYLLVNKLESREINILSIGSDFIALYARSNIPKLREKRYITVYKDLREQVSLYEAVISDEKTDSLPQLIEEYNVLYNIIKNVKKLLAPNIFNDELKLAARKLYIAINSVIQDRTQHIILMLEPIASKANREIDSKVVDFFEKIQETEAKSTIKANDFLNKFENTSTKASDAFDQNVTSQINQFSSTVNESIEKLDLSLENKRSETLNAIKKAALDGNRQLKESLDQPIAQLNQRIDAEVAQFESKKSYMNEMLEKLGLATDANVTLQQANKEEAMANELRTKGLALLYLSIILLVLFFSEFIGLDVISISSSTLSDINFEQLGIPVFFALIACSLKKWKWLDSQIVTKIGTEENTNNNEEIDQKIRNKTKSELASAILLCTSCVSAFFILSKYFGYEFFNEIEITDGYNKPDIQDFALRFMTVLLVTSPAIYMLKESAAHRAKENLYRQRGTQLVAISGYLSDLDYSSKSDVKQKLAENFFSFYDGKPDTSNVPDFIKHMNDAVSLAKTINTDTKSTESEKKETNTTGS